MLIAKIIDVVVRLETADRVNGGLTALRDLMKSFNRTYREDQHLAAISWMDMHGAYDSAEELARHGLRFDKSGKDTDIAIYEMYSAIPHVNPAWITRAEPGGTRGYWLTGTEPGDPVDWEEDEKGGPEPIDIDLGPFE